MDSLARSLKYFKIKVMTSQLLMMLCFCSNHAIFSLVFYFNAYKVSALLGS